MWLTFIGVLQIVITGTSCLVNVAYTPEQELQAIATMSENAQNGWTADKCVDGNTNQNYSANSCAIMDFSGNYSSAWLRVELQTLFNIGYLKIFFPVKSLAKSAGFSVYMYAVDNFDPSSLDADHDHLVYQHDPLSGCPASTMTIVVRRIVKYIVIKNKRPTGFVSNCSDGSNSSMFTTIEICEVQVLGCSPDRYGTCYTLCPTICKNGQCDIFSGSCIYGCANPDALTSDCIACPPHYYGNECNALCGYCGGNATCDNVTGQCHGGCMADWHGVKCDLNCIGHCKNKRCDKLTRKCLQGCENSWTGEFCQTCPPHYYGNECNASCGYCAGNAACDNVTGQCHTGCMAGWHGVKCDYNRVDVEEFRTLDFILISAIAVSLLASLILGSLYCNIKRNAVNRRNRSGDPAVLHTTDEAKDFRTKTRSSQPKNTKL